MIRYVLAFAVALGAGVPTARAGDDLPQVLSADAEAAAIRSAQATGLLVYRHDQAAAVATDAALALARVKRDKRLSGWLTEERADGIVVTFIDQTPAALYRVPVSADGVAGKVEILESPAALTAYEAGAATARAVAMKTDFFQPCSNTYNTVVLPGAAASGKDWVVYLLPATTRNDTVPIGGTFRIEVDDNKVVARRGFTKTCIALHTGPEVGGLMITHLLDPVPTEAHVYWSLWARKTMYVATAPDGTTWAVEGAAIRRLKDDDGTR